jgi:hypothetical protein
MSGPFGAGGLQLFSGAKDFYGHTIEHSCRFASESSGYLQRAVSHNRRTFTYSFWFKRTSIDRQMIFGNYTSGSNVCTISFDGTPHIKFEDFQSGYQINIASVNLQRDPTGWAHYVAAVDTTQGTASNRVKVYINGTQQTTLNTSHDDYPSQNHDSKFGDGGTHRIGTEGTNERLFLNCYLAEFHIIDGSALGPESFGETKNGIWIPKDTSGLTYGSGGVRLQFQDSSSLGDDTSGNGNDFTSSGLGADHQVKDTPTSNFNVPTLDLESNGGSTGRQESDLYTFPSSNGTYFGHGTSMPLKGGKWYMEYYALNQTSTSNAGVPNVFVMPEGVYYKDNASVPSGAKSIGSGTQDGSNRVYMVALDLDNGRAYYGSNGSWSNGASLSNVVNGDSTGASQTFTAAELLDSWRFGMESLNDGGAAYIFWNFGTDSTFGGRYTAESNADANGFGEFKYAVPSGYLAMVAQNQPITIDNADNDPPTDYFDTILYTGDGSSSREIDGLSFQPDWIWFKQRSGSADNHRLHDVVRGNTKHLSSDEGYAEGTESNTLLSFDNDGFTIGNAGQINENSQTFVAWNWKAGGSASSNSNGSITSSVSVSQESGFSVVGYTGTGSNGTVGHGLGVVPQLIIIKCRTLDSTDWVVYHEDIGNAKALHLNSNGTGTSGSGFFNNTSPTSTVFSISTDNRVNQSASDTYIAYCFANVDGYQKIGSFKGNGNDDGPLINVGFRPAWVMVKRTDSTNNWFIFDSVRAPSNRNDAAFAFLRANLSNAEASNVKFEFNSTAFKPRDASAGFNADGGTYVYLAFAEQPFKFANAR